ncbi:hypothetical protein WMF30_51625 [Sorangium sp. So ce134]
MPERPVKPSDCALAICIPLTEGAFFADLDPASPKDFVKTRAAAHPGITPAARWEDYRPLAQTVRQLQRELAPYEVTFAPYTTLESFRELLRWHAVVTLVAHWRFVPFEAGDIVDVAGLARKLAAPRTPIQRWIAGELARRGRRDLLAAGDPSGGELHALRDAMGAELRSLLDAGHAIYHPQATRSGQPPAPGAGGGDAPERLTRAALESEFPAEIRPGAAVEFYDGLRTIDAIVSAIPEGFDGVLDLTICNSILLGEAIKRRRSGFLIICNQRRTAIQARLIRYKYIIKALACHEKGERFTDVVARLSLAALERSI